MNCPECGYSYIIIDNTEDFTIDNMEVYCHCPICECEFILKNLTFNTIEITKHGLDYEE